MLMSVKNVLSISLVNKLNIVKVKSISFVNSVLHSDRGQGGHVTPPPQIFSKKKKIYIYYIYIGIFRYHVITCWAITLYPPPVFQGMLQPCVEYITSK